jgi:GT2 family glycosyltransferase
MRMPDISIVIVTSNRFELLKKCTEAVIRTTAKSDKEIIIWDNSSADETALYLKELEDKHDFLKAVFNPVNIGVNAKAKAVELAKGNYIIGIDDDVIELPEEWAEKMKNAFRKVNNLGYLALDVVQDKHTNGAKHPPESYEERDYGDGITLQFGPVGGWCFMIPREVYKRVGKLRTSSKTIFFSEDGDYIIRAEMKGYISAILKDVKCYHATGEYYNSKYRTTYDLKMKHWYSSDKDMHKIIRKIKYSLFKVKKKLLG